MRLVRSADLPADLHTAIEDLWAAAFGPSFDANDAAHAMGGTHALLLGDRDELIAHASVVRREIVVGRRPFLSGYVEGVATDPTRQGAGHGSAVMEAIADVIRAEHELGVLSTGRTPFYERLGWERWVGPTYVIWVDGGRRRTADEDDGIMVLRFGPSADIDLSLPIACEDRPGDAW